MAELDAILARLERLEAENEDLRRRISEASGATRQSEPARLPTVSRRTLLRQAGTGAATLGIGVLGASAVALAAPRVVRANGEPLTVGGSYTDAVTTTSIRNHANDNDVLLGHSSGAGAGLNGYSGKGDGVFGESSGGYGVHGVSLSDSGAGVVGTCTGNFGVLGIGDTGVGVQGESKTGEGVVGGSTSADGVHGFSTTASGVSGYSASGDGVTGLSPKGTGVLGRSEGPAGVGVRGFAGNDVPPGVTFGTGVLGSSGVPTYPAARANTGVMGVGAKGRGGVFIGDLAQIQLVASSAANHPASGGRGDLFVDNSGRLWFCKGGRSWRQLG